jgi:coenzyme F420-dependent glucose-6-phosphate dehydrogenase
LSGLKISVNIGEGYNDPMRFVECAVLAERYGFDTVWFGDHLLPWIHNQNKSAFVWSVMASALDRTKRIRVGPIVTSPIGGRYQPAIIGQAAATLDNMYPGRFQLGVGSGEAINEINFFPNGWPRWQERIDRLAEAVVLMKRMWEDKQYFNHQGKYFKMNNFFLYTKPKTKIPIYFAAQGRKAAAYSGIYGDHLVTVNSPKTCQEVIFPVFEDSARKVGKNPSQMEKMVEVSLYFADKYAGVEEVRKSGEAGFFASDSFDQTDPRKVQEMANTVSDETIVANFCFVLSPDDIVQAIEKYSHAGATHIELVTHSFPERIELIGEKVLPHFIKEER